LNKKLAGILKLFIFFGLGVFLVWLSVRNFTDDQWASIGKAIREADYLWVGISMLLGLLAHMSRAARWKMLMQPLGHNPSLANTFFGVTIGYIANYAFPRLGEVTRCGVLTRYEKIPFEESFGTVVAERIIDMITMLLFFFFTLAVQFTEIYSQVELIILDPLSRKLSVLMANKPVFYIAVGGLLFGFLALFLLRKRIKNMFSGKMKKILTGFGEGFRSVRKVKRPWLFIAHSLFIWLMYYASVHVIFMAFGETSHLGVKAGLAVLMFGTLGVIFTPGGIGAYPLLVTQVLLSLYGIREEMGTAFGWVTWTSQFVLILVLGLLSLVLLPLFNRGKAVEKIKA
jgi:uncharacterized protein (TIRG00374 family)